MDVRLARPTDAPLALALALDRGSHLVTDSDWPTSNPVFHTLLQSIFPLATVGRIWVARDGGSAALLEARPRRYVLGWDINRLVVRGQIDDVLAAVVESAVGHVQRRGVPRLFVRCNAEGACQLKKLDFQMLAQEYVLVGPGQSPPEESPAPADSRYRMPSDAWPLHQLETEITPALIRQLEGLSSVDWSAAPPKSSEIVVERDGRIVAWVGWEVRRRQGRGRIGLMVHPDHRELASELVQHVMEQVPAGCRLTARVRDYQGEILSALSDAGFQVMAEEILMVKHARAVLARVKRARIQVAHVPSMHAFNAQSIPSGRDPGNASSG